MSAVAVAEDAAAPRSEPGVFLQVRDLVKEFPVTRGVVLQRRVGAVHAVSGITFNVNEAATLGLVGESGCGKTTTGRLIVGLEKPTSGSIRIGGDDIARIPRRRLRRKRRDMQMMFQDPYASLDPRMRVASILREPLVIQRIGTRRQQNERLLELLSEVGLSSSALDRYPHEFSGGQRQRVGLARALAMNPKLIVADEPVSALDVSIRSQILNLMNRLQERHSLTYVIISHDLSVVKYMADRIGVMYLGKLVEVGSGNDIYHAAAHPYTHGLVSSIPIPDPEIERRKPHDAPRGEIPSAINPPSGCRFRTRCPRAQQLCAEVEPPMRPFGVGHLAACHFPLQTPLQLEPAEPAATA
jgi:peptide/nickel transport system ATP-binding protein